MTAALTRDGPIRCRTVQGNDRPACSSFAPAHGMLGHLLSQMGRHDEALQAVRDACEVDPRSALASAMSSQVAFQARDFVAAADPKWDGYRADPRFQHVLERCGYATGRSAL